MKTDDWFDLHLNPDVARYMSRADYYKSRSWLRRVRHITRLRYESAKLDPFNPCAVLIPSTDDVLPKLFH